MLARQLCILFLAAIVRAHHPHDDIAALHATEDGSDVFAVCRAGLFVSNDGGNTWQLRGRGLRPMLGVSSQSFGTSALLVSPKSLPESSVLLLDGMALWKSSDGGWTFERSSYLHGCKAGGLARVPGTFGASMRYVIGETPVVLLVGCNKLYRSIDSGRTLESLSDRQGSVVACVTATYVATNPVSALGLGRVQPLSFAGL